MRKISALSALSCLLLYSTCQVALAQEPGAYTQQASPSVKEVNYLCERNVELPVVYFTDANNIKFATALIEGNLVLMQERTLNSGVYYIAVNEQISYRLKTDGLKASVTFMEASDEAASSVVLNACEAYEDDGQE